MKRYLLASIAMAIASIPVTAQQTVDTAAVTPRTDAVVSQEPPEKVPAPLPATPPDASGFKLSATIDVQVQKNLYDEYWSASTNRFISNTGGIVTGYRYVVDDFWMRAALKATYQNKYLEGVFALRFYPYWTVRKKDPNTMGTGNDLTSYWDVIELNQAYVKVFKEYSPQDNLTFRPHFKLGRDGLLNGCSQLFGNYLDQPAGGYGDSRYNNIVGPFKNRKVFANQMEVGFAFNVFDMVGGTTSIMVGANLNTEKFYDATATQFLMMEDSKLSAGFFRAYQDLFFLNKRVHLGGGVRRYVSIQDSAESLIRSTYLTAQWAFEAVIVKDVKCYTEMAMQKMSSTSSTGIVRPINVGITIPTFGALDTLAIEWENVAQTFFLHNPFYSLFYDKPLFNDRSMRDAISGRSPTVALGWGIVAQKQFFKRIVIAWGLYSGNPTGDMQTTLRISSNF